MSVPDDSDPVGSWSPSPHVPQGTVPVHAENDPLPPGSRVASHHHDVDQLTWPQHGGASIRLEDQWWRIDQGHLVWIPAHTQHEIRTEGADALLSLYVDPALRPSGDRWLRPLALPVDELTAQVLRHLCLRERSPERRLLALGLVRDILEHSEESRSVLALPRHPAARTVAEAILADPADPRTLTDWATALGVSSKTLLRAFRHDTGVTFAQWRTRARTHEATRLLDEGWTVQDVAAAVGYATSTGFIKAYRSIHRTTPARHAARQRRRPSGEA